MELIEQNIIDNNIDVLLVNEKWLQHKKRKKVAKELGLGFRGKSKLNKKMKLSGYKFDRKMGQYIANNKGALTIVNENIIADDANNINLFNNDEMKNKLIDMVENYDKIKSIIDKYYTDNIDVIDVEMNLVADENWNYKRTTIEVDEKVWEDFGELCRTKHKGLSKRELTTIAIEQFIKNNQ